MMYGRVKGGRSWHLVGNRAVTMCQWRPLVDIRDLPAGPLCAKCYAIREELAQ